ncbi:MAG TPA: hypothetical protein VHB68_07180, partial [Steroidobacteraceae bacterium]|nr:hypothetical protein [Steroidobacteraceae bacterium]
RLDLMRRRLGNRSDLTAGTVLAALNSHFTELGALCCHPDSTRPGTGQYATLATILFDVAGGSLEALPGGPCRHAPSKSSA